MKRNMILAVMVAEAIATLTASAAVAAPVAKIPFDRTSVRVDGEIREEEWENAAVLRDIRPLGSAYAGECRTEFRIKHCGETVYVGVCCSETETGLPIGFARAWSDSFFRNDDCVEIVLGTADSELRDRGAINVGGYENAMGTAVAAADDYYSFVVNAVGARQRCYNEMPVGDDGFESACRVGSGYWTVEMAIPCKTLGLVTFSDGDFCANLIRYRHPAMLGWHLPAFGGYAPMPFGRFRFMREGAGHGTKENWPVHKQRTPGHGVAAAIAYGPLDHAVVGTVTVAGDKDGIEAELAVEGLPVVRKPITKDRDFVVCELPPGNQPERTATLAVWRDGKCVCKERRICKAAILPDWLGTNEGKEYLREKIPVPWTMPQIHGRGVRLVDKTIVFGNNALPQSVDRVGALSTTFRAPVTLRAVVAGKPAAVKYSEPLMRIDGNRVFLSAVGRGDGLVVQSSAILDYDGFLDYTFSVEGDQVSAVDRLELVFPFCGEAARHFLPGNLVQQGGMLSDAGWRGVGCPFWVGNEQEGLSFSYDESPFRSVCRRGQLRVENVDGGRNAILLLSDAKGQVANGDAFRFFLLPTPTKPYPIKPVRNRYGWIWEDWSSWHGYPDVSKADNVSKMVSSLAKRGKKTLLYCCQGLQEDAPEMLRWREDFSQQPQWRYYHWRGHDCLATCKQGPEGDFQLASWAKIIQDSGIAGVVGDGFFMTWNCDNPLHAHHPARCAAPKLGQETRSRTVMQRDFLKRMRGLFDRTGRPFCLLAHTGGGLDPSYLSFCDAYFEGEQLSRFRRGYYPPRALYSIGYTGMPWGWRTIYWPKAFHNYNGLDTALVYALLHNSEYNANPDVEPPDADTELLEPFSAEDAKFHPYWKKQCRVVFNSDAALLSLYERTNAVLLVVGNISPSPVAYTLDFSTLWPDSSVCAQDVLRKTPVYGSLLSETLAPFSCRIVMVRKSKAEGKSRTAEEPLPEPMSKDADKLARTWTFSGGAFGGVSTNGVVRIKGSPAKRAATAVNIATFGRNLVVRGKLSCTDRVRISLGDNCITYHGGHAGGGWRFKGLIDPYGRGWVYNSVTLRKNIAVDFRLVLKDNVLDVWYDGQRLVRRLALSLPPSGNRFSFSTWHTDSLEFVQE